MANNFVGFRPGKKDTAIMTDLGQYRNQSARVRELLLLGMAVERGEYVKATDIPKVLVAPELSPEQVEVFKEQWERVQGSIRPAPPLMPVEAVSYQHVAVAVADDEDEIRRNMLGGFE